MPVDIAQPSQVKVLIRADSKVLWVNVDGACQLRCCRIGELVVNDERVGAEMVLGQDERSDIVGLIETGRTQECLLKLLDILVALELKIDNNHRILKGMVDER